MDTHDRFVEWLRDGGAALEGLAIGEGQRGRGVVATRGFAEGEVVARVPRRLLITREHANASSVGRQIRAAGVALSGTHALFAAWLGVERRDPRTAFAPYLEILPDDFAGAALSATAAERALVTGTLTGALLDALEADVDHDHGALTTHVRLWAGRTLADYTWARLCVASRVFALTIDGIATTALVPLGDLLNHAHEPATRWTYDDAAEAFTLTAARTIAAGAEVTDSYGPKSNSQLVVQYGFVLDDNPAAEVELCGHRVTADVAAAPAEALLAALRTRHCDDQVARAALRSEVAAALARCPGTTADDAAILADPAATALARALVRARRDERAALEAWRAFAIAPTP
ncbi:MAG: SET domain-containing protein [Myxococcales bacterium]|nr:SET domain-containing protein [Myxococcales bacterium]